MKTQNWILENKRSGATSCFLLGEIENHKVLCSFKKYNQVVWFINENNLPKQSLGYKNVYPMTLETIDTVKLDEIVSILVNENVSIIPDIFCSEKILEDHVSSFNMILERIQVKSEEKLRVSKMRKHEGFGSQKNIFENLPYFIENRLNNQTENLLKGKPVAVVGAGPSLDYSIHILEKFHHDFYIFCVDSAVSKLNEKNIKPDAVFTIDAEKKPDDCLSKNQKFDSLFLSLKSPPQWTKLKETKKYFLSANIMTENWLAEYGFSKTKPKVIGNCGITAANMAIFLGCSPIMLFGLDHAADEKTGKGHAESVNPNVSRATYNPKFCYHTVPGNYEPRVKTFLLNEWDKLNKLLSSAPHYQEIWNITDRGAKYDKAKLIHPDNFTFNKKEKTDNKDLRFSTQKIKTSEIQNLALKLKSFTQEHSELFRSILEIDAINDETCVLLSNLYKIEFTSKLLPNFTFKIAPILLDWINTAYDEKVEVLSETKTLIMEIFTLTEKFDKRNEKNH